MKILLIRHGETTGDIEERYGGAYDDHLTERGHAQLAETAEKLRGQAIDTMYVSTLARAQESAAILNKVLETTIVSRNDLQERNYGVLGGLTKAEALERYPEAVAAHKDPANTDPEGEAQVDFTARVIEAFREITASEGEQIAIVAHGGVLKTILKHLGEPVPHSIPDGGVIEVYV